MAEPEPEPLPREFWWMKLPVKVLDEPSEWFAPNESWGWSRDAKTCAISVEIPWVRGFEFPSAKHARPNWHDPLKFKLINHGVRVLSPESQEAERGYQWMSHWAYEFENGRLKRLIARVGLVWTG